MRCRHTVPDWHRYVAGGEDASPIFAACRLLIKEGERASQPQAIACTFWGRQRECPVYDGPEPRRADRPAGSMASSVWDVPVSPESVWPVRLPGSADVERVLLLGLGGLSAILLALTVLFGLSALGGGKISTAHLAVTLVAATLSLVVHLLTLRRLWVRR
jgi:hypothetical protein